MRHQNYPLTPELIEARDKIREVALDYGLDFFETIFELVDYDQLNAIAAYGGFPIRYPHWRFGMEYEKLAKSYTYGLSKIYELVINNDPCYAYLMTNNHLVDQKMVMAHVYGHCDFFKNNFWFSKTNRKMIDTMANHASKIRSLVKKVGFEEMEKFVDVCLSIENLIDFYQPYIKRHAEPEKAEDGSSIETKITRFKTKGYMDEFINPPEFIERQREKLKKMQEKKRRFPAEPVRDVLIFLLENAPLEPWQQTVLSIIHDEACYFAPQGQTKIMNEGWACYWHTTIMTNNIMSDADVVHYADHHSGTVATAPGQLNPYKLGLELFRDIERRWNMGQFGKEWEECDDYNEKINWDKQLNLGRKKIFEVRTIHNDVTFIDAFLTKEFVEAQRLFSYKYQKERRAYIITDRDFQQIKRTLLTQLTNFGQPIIKVLDANYRNRGELYLFHQFEGVPLKKDYAVATLINLHKLWTRPVHIETIEDERPYLYSFDGSETQETQMAASNAERRIKKTA